MPRLYNKINLPTNTTDIQMFAKYLRAINKIGVVTKEQEQKLFADVKIAGSRKGVTAPKKDTHTKQTLNVFGLIVIDSDGSFQVSSLGKEVINYFDSPESHSEEERVALMLKVFMNWKIDDEAFNRHMNPGVLIIKLLCDPDLNYYFTNQELADFVMNENYISDEQYDEIKKGILSFREGIGISKYVAQSKVGIFLSTFVSNWNFLNSYDIELTSAQIKQGDKFYNDIIGTTTDDDDNQDDNDVSSDMSASERNAYSSFHTIKRYNLIGIAAYISQLYLYMIEGREIINYKSYFSNNKISQQVNNRLSQTIYFGAPGTGKSYKIENDILKDVPDTSKFRVTFYPDYYYSDFIGGLRPKKQGDDITYEFSAGPFAEALLKSFTEPTYLIIEEINRGNPAAIFGDIFQLLDRRDDGRSRYETTNEDLYKYLVRENADLEAVLPENKVFLPADLHILCTMNTADQNVFVLDTAFKRRFSMEYVPIDMDVFDSDPKVAPYKAEGYPAFDGTEDLAALLGETGSGITSPKRNWPTFAAFVNAKIDEINSSETKISEDKKLGPFFAGPEDFSDRKKFADKVLYYLKQDVFKYEDTILTDSYEKLYEKFTEESMDIFSIFE